MVLGDESGFDLARGLIEAPRLEGLTVILISTYAERDFADLIAASFDTLLVDAVAVGGPRRRRGDR
jgi:hypothetical protein